MVQYCRVSSVAEAVDELTRWGAELSARWMWSSIAESISLAPKPNILRAVFSRRTDCS